jgi:DNA-binding PadR family transcriptional regulator
MYPLMRRLEQLGLLKSSSARTGRRERREYGITRAGVAALRTWVGPPMPPEAISVAYDPLRSRARFLGVLTENQRLAWIEAAEHALAEVASAVQRWQELLSGDDRFMNLTTRHGEIETEARRRWLEEVRADLNERDRIAATPPPRRAK